RGWAGGGGVPAAGGPASRELVLLLGSAGQAGWPPQDPAGRLPVARGCGGGARAAAPPAGWGSGRPGADGRGLGGAPGGAPGPAGAPPRPRGRPPRAAAPWPAPAPSG